MKVIKEKLLDAVQDETGIRLTSKDFNLAANEGDLQLSLWGNELLSMPYEDGQLDDEDYAEDVVSELFQEHYDLREKIIELKLDDLNSKHLPGVTEKIISGLEENKVDHNLLDILDFEFVNFGYNNGNFTTPGEEEWDYPQIVLRVSDFEELEHFINIDPYKDPSALDYKLITNEIIKKIRGKI